MSSGFLSDPEGRRAYLLTKAGMLVFAFLLTWPLSRWFGNRAWLGFCAFAVLLALSTLLFFAVGGRSSTTGRDSSPPEEDAATTLEAEEDQPVVIPVEDALDLHPFQPRDIPKVVRDYVEAAWEAGYREVRLIHGRGIGVQRERVRSVLAKHKLVLEFHDAPPEAGGWGATIAHLRDGHRH